MFEGKGSYGIVYSSPRLPFDIKFFFIFDNDKDTNTDFVGVKYEEIILVKKEERNKRKKKEKNIEIDKDSGVFHKLQQPSVSPAAPHPGQALLGATEQNKITNELITNQNIFLEVSKVFFDEKDYKNEYNNYIKIINVYKINPDYFNFPLNYGTINKSDISRNTNIYNEIWSCKNNKYLECNHHITFRKGIKIFKNNNSIDFLIKLLNILDAIKYLNENCFLFDDFKMENILEVENVFKISDFNSLIKFDEITYDIYCNSEKKGTYMSCNMDCIFYYIYSPILNKLVYYYLCEEEDLEVNFNDIINDILKYYKNEDFISYLDYLKNIVIFLRVHCKNELFVNLDCYKKENHSYIKCNVNISIKDILSNLFFYLDMTDKNKKILCYNLFFKVLHNYLEITYEKNLKKIINNLFERINIYSLGILFANILTEKLNNLHLNKDFFRDLFEIIAMCCLSSFNLQNVMYVNQPDINLIIQKYKELILKKYCNYELICEKDKNVIIRSFVAPDSSEIEVFRKLHQPAASYLKQDLQGVDEMSFQTLLKSTTFNM